MGRRHTQFYGGKPQPPRDVEPHCRSWGDRSCRFALLVRLCIFGGRGREGVSLRRRLGCEWGGRRGGGRRSGHRGHGRGRRLLRAHPAAHAGIPRVESRVGGSGEEETPSRTDSRRTRGTSAWTSADMQSLPRLPKLAARVSPSLCERGGGDDFQWRIELQRRMRATGALKGKRIRHALNEASRGRGGRRGLGGEGRETRGGRETQRNEGILWGSETTSSGHVRGESGTMDRIESGEGTAVMAKLERN